MNLFENHNIKKIKGLDLKIDATVQKLCDISNNSSSQTRAVLYILVIISIVSVIAVVNTFPYANWTKERIQVKKDRLKGINDSILQLKNNDANFLRDSQRIYMRKKIVEIEIEKEISNKVERVATVQLPILGNAFDVNNLAILTGIGFVIILIIARYTSSREKKNLRIALHAITERYPEPEDYLNETTKIIDILPSAFIIDDNLVQKYKALIDDKAIKSYNLIRRRFHYNYLSMNEVFTSPEDALMTEERDEERIETISFKKSPVAKFIMKYLLFFPFSVYLIIIVNDLLSLKVGLGLSISHTIVQYTLSYICLITIAFLCRECNNQKLISQAYYDNFIANEYKFDYQKNKIDLPNRKGNVFVYPFFLMLSSLNLIRKLILYMLKQQK